MSEIDDIKARAAEHTERQTQADEWFREGSIVTSNYNGVTSALLTLLDRAIAIAECDICYGTPHPSGLPCICGGTNTAQAASLALRVAVAAKDEVIIERGEELKKARDAALALRDLLRPHGHTTDVNCMGCELIRRGLADTEWLEQER